MVLGESKSDFFEFQKITENIMVIEVLTKKDINSHDDRHLNISTITGLLTLTGLPFPLLSLGGSSMVSTAVIFGITNRIFIEYNLATVSPKILIRFPVY